MVGFHIYISSPSAQHFKASWSRNNASSLIAPEYLVHRTVNMQNDMLTVPVIYTAGQ